MLSLIVAMTEQRVIGRDNTLPWHLSDDLKRFKKITMGHPIIMGRKTYDSIGRPLPGRQNIVITRDPDFKVEGVTVAHTILEAFGLCDATTGEEFIIGGASVFAATLPLAQKIYLTIIHKKFEGDVYFPQIDLIKDYRLLDEVRLVTPPPEEIPYSYITVERVRPSK